MYIYIYIDREREREIDFCMRVDSAASLPRLLAPHRGGPEDSERALQGRKYCIIAVLSVMLLLVVLLLLYIAIIL